MPEPIKFFGAVDREKNDPNGKILSAYPAWYYDEKIDRLSDDIIVRENKINSGRVPAASLEEERKELQIRKERMKAIKTSKPKMVGKEKDEVAKFYRYIKDQVINRLPSRTDIQRGTVNIRSEVMWKKKPSIDISDYIVMCESLGLVMPEKKKITGHQAMLSLKILAKLLGEESNIERLRRDFNNNTYRPEVGLNELVQQGQGMAA
jgi:hypothetical protein